jgi:Transglycosylase SLT domain
MALLMLVITAPAWAGGIASRSGLNEPITWSGTLHYLPGRNAGSRLTDPSRQCEVAIARAEALFALPPGLLMAIALVESGRLEPGTGKVRPWPWSINAAGQGLFFDSQAEAVHFVRGLQKQGVASIDIGCLQVNQFFHPVFASLADAFDPEENADYAARFLRQLYAETGNWTAAAGLYHSRTPLLAASYRQAVALRLANTAASAFKLRAVAAHESALLKLQAAWAATLVDKAATQSYPPPQASGIFPDARFADRRDKPLEHRRKLSQ